MAVMLGKREEQGLHPSLTASQMHIYNAPIGGVDLRLE